MVCRQTGRLAQSADLQVSTDGTAKLFRIGRNCIGFEIASRSVSAPLLVLVVFPGAAAGRWPVCIPRVAGAAWVTTGITDDAKELFH